MFPGNCRRFGSNKLIEVLTGLDISYADNSTLFRKPFSLRARHLPFVVRPESTLTLTEAMHSPVKTKNLLPGEDRGLNTLRFSRMTGRDTVTEVNELHLYAVTCD